MKLKKMMALVLCATTVAGLGLTGCGNSSDNSAAGDATSAAKESSDAGKTDASDFSGNITVQKALPRMLLTDTQINSVAKAYINDENFGSFGSELNMWKFYNLLTGANKSSYIDSFLDRSLNATEMAVGINAALHGDERYKWFID